MGASISVGVGPGDKHASIFELLLNERRPGRRCSRRAGRAEPASRRPARRRSPASTRRCATRGNPSGGSRDCIRPLAATVDDVVIDSPSNFTVLSLSVPSLAEHLIVPIRADYLSLESLAHFLRWYRDRGARRAGMARISGILLTMVDYRREATREIVDIIRVHNRRGVFHTEIPADPRVPEAPSHGIPLMRYARSTRGAGLRTSHERAAAARRAAREVTRRGSLALAHRREVL